MSITNVEKSRCVLTGVSKDTRHRYKSHGIFDIRQGVRYVQRTRYALRGEGDLYHIEAQLYRMGVAHISILRSKNIDKNARYMEYPMHRAFFQNHILPYSPKIRLPASGKNSFTKSTFCT